MARRSSNSSVIREDGLRYASRAAGSQFSTGTMKSTMSCFKCGAHRASDAMKSQRILGKSRRVCAPSCPERK